MLYVAKNGDDHIHCFDLELDPNTPPEEGEEDVEKWPIYRVSTAAPIVGFALSPNQKWLFAITELGSVEMFESRRSGRLNRFPALDIPAGNGVEAGAITPNSQAVYFATDAGKIFGFAVNSSGNTLLGTPSGVAGPANPSFAVIRPDGKALYVSDEAAGKVWQYAILPGGNLQPLSPATVDVAGGPASMLWSNDSSKLYICCKASSQVAQFSTVPGGQIAEVSRVAGPGQPGIPALSLGENFLFVPSNDGSGEIWRYQVGASLSALMPPRQTNHGKQIEAKLSGQDIVVLNGDDDNFSTYRVAADGTLSLLETKELLSNPVASAYRRLP